MTNSKVLLITARSDIGGGPKYTLDYARALKDAGYEVFIASPLDAPYGPEFVKVAKEHFALSHRSFSPFTLFKLKDFAQKYGVRIIHSHGRGAGFYSRLLKHFGFTVVHSFHGIHQAPSLAGRLKFYLDRWLTKFTDGFVFVSRSEKDEALRTGFAITLQTAVIPPLAPPVWRDAPTTYQTPLRMGSISRFDHQKGIDLLFQNLAFFHTKHPELNWTFELAGAGNYAFKIPNSIRDRVRLLGATDRPIEFLRTLDLYLANSRWESFNITVVEALSQGLPALVSQVAGHEYFIENGVATGFAPSDSAEFASALYTLIVRGKPEAQFAWVTQHHSKMQVDGIYDRFLS